MYTWINIFSVRRLTTTKNNKQKIDTNSLFTQIQYENIFGHHEIYFFVSFVLAINIQL